MTLVELAEKTVEGLEAVEWCDLGDVVAFGGEPRCQECDNRESREHAPDCSLAAALASARELLARLMVQQEQDGQGWRTMESAPKDVDVLLRITPLGHMAVACWRYERWVTSWTHDTLPKADGWRPLPSEASQKEEE